MLKKLLFICLFVGSSLNSFSQTVNSNYVDGAIYLKLNDTTNATLDLAAASFPALSNLFAVHSVTQVEQPFKNINIGLSQTYRLLFSQITTVNAFINGLQQITYIDYAEGVPLFYTSQVPNDLQANQWYLSKINAPQAWDLSVGNNAVKIAIVDNAVSTVHEDLTASIAINSGEIPNNGLDDDFNGYTDDYKGYDVANGDSDVNPPSSAGTNSPWVHGTHCAGIASASTNNGIGMAGIGYNCSIIPVKCTPNSSAGNTLSAAYEGVAYAMNAGANVISMSFGSSGSSLTGQNIINAAYAQGITLLAAAGNDNSTAQFYPAAYPQVISVGATDVSDQKASFSNYGTTIDVMAPGVGIYSTFSGATNAYGSLSGTSMACPLTAGLCGLIVSQDINRTPMQVKNILVSGCENIDLMNANYAGQMGAGRIDAYKSLLGDFLHLESKENNEIRIYPNPFQQEINLKTELNSLINVYSASGKNIENRISDGEMLQIGLNYLPGIYYVLVVNGETSESFKIVKL